MVDIDIWAQKVTHHLQSHMDMEKEAVSFYRHVADGASSDRIRLVMNMIRDDDLQHHRILERMLGWMRAEHSQRDANGPQLGFEPVPEKNQEHMLDHTRKLIELAKQDEARLKELSQLVAQVADTEWWVVLVDSIRRDVERHLMLLRAVEGMLEG